jgi:hypothetical protein
VLSLSRPAHGFCGARFVPNAGGTAVVVENTNGRLTTGGAVERRAFFRIFEDGQKTYQATGIPANDDGESADGVGEIVACKDSWHLYRTDIAASRLPGVSSPTDFPDGTDSADVNSLDVLRERRGLPNEDAAIGLFESFGANGSDTISRELTEANGAELARFIVDRQLAPGVTYEIDDEYDEDGFASGRGGFGTTTPFRWGANNPTGTVVPSVADYTIAVDLAKRESRRWAWGSFTFKAFASFADIGLECGDLARVLNDDRLIGALDSFIDSNYIWEVTGREIRVLDDSPGIEFEFTIFRVDSFTFEIFRDIPTVTPEIPIPEIDPAPEFIVDNALVDVFIDGDGDGTLDTGVIRG